MTTLAAASVTTPQCEICGGPAALLSDPVWIEPRLPHPAPWPSYIESDGTLCCSDCSETRRWAIFFTEQHTSDADGGALRLVLQLNAWCGDRAVGVVHARFARLVRMQLPRHLWERFDVAWAHVGTYTRRAAEASVA